MKLSNDQSMENFQIFMHGIYNKINNLIYTKNYIILLKYLNVYLEVDSLYKYELTLLRYLYKF